MAVLAETLETYDSVTLREDLVDAENMISPDETPFHSMIAGAIDVSPTGMREYHEWPIAELSTPDDQNNVVEGEDAPDLDPPVDAVRRGNYCQLFDKTVKISDTVMAVQGAASIQSMAKQIAYKLRQLKREKERVFTGAGIAKVGVAEGGEPRIMSGLGGFLFTNFFNNGTIDDAVAPILSDAPHGFPNVAYDPGSSAAEAILDEALLNTAIQAAYVEGGNVKYVLVDPFNKSLILSTFTQSSQLHKSAGEDMPDSVSVYESDFGTVMICPDRWMPVDLVYCVDPSMVSTGALQATHTKDLDRLGHTQNKIIIWEGTLEVSNEKAHAMIVNAQRPAV